MRLAFATPVPAVMAHPPLLGVIGLLVLLAPLTNVHEVSVGKNPVPLTRTSSPIDAVPGLRDIDGPPTTLRTTCAKSPWLPLI